MYTERHVLTLTTDGSGDAIGYTPAVYGRLLGFRYVKSDYTDGVDITVTAEATGESLLALTNQNTSGSFYPRQQVHGATGTGLTYDGTRTICEPVALAGDRVKVVVAQGGAAKVGTFHILIG